MRRCVAHKGPSGASITYCNISCFNIIFKYHKWAGEQIYIQTVHLTLTYNFNAYPMQVSMSVTLTLRQQQFGKQILLMIKGVHSRILTLSANIYNGCLSPI